MKRLALIANLFIIFVTAFGCEKKEEPAPVAAPAQSSQEMICALAPSQSSVVSHFLVWQEEPAPQHLLSLRLRG